MILYLYWQAYHSHTGFQLLIFYWPHSIHHIFHTLVYIFSDLLHFCWTTFRLINRLLFWLVPWNLNVVLLGLRLICSTLTAQFNLRHDELDVHILESYAGNAKDISTFTGPLFYSSPLVEFQVSILDRLIFHSIWPVLS